MPQGPRPTDPGGDPCVDLRPMIESGDSSRHSDMMRSRRAKSLTGRLRVRQSHVFCGGDRQHTIYNNFVAYLKVFRSRKKGRTCTLGSTSSVIRPLIFPLRVRPCYLNKRTFLFRACVFFSFPFLPSCFFSSCHQQLSVCLWSYSLAIMRCNTSKDRCQRGLHEEYQTEQGLCFGSETLVVQCQRPKFSLARSRLL